MDKLRIDKWLWAARFYKTRTLATDEIGKGRVAVNGQDVNKPAREVKVGDTVAVRREGLTRTVVVKGLSDMRGPAPVAQQLYEETPESLKASQLILDAQQRSRRHLRRPTRLASPPGANSTTASNTAPTPSGQWIV